MEELSSEAKELYKTYFGKSSGYYMKQLEVAEGKRQTRYNFYAFFFNYFWLAYRKQYLLIFFLLLANVIITILFDIYFLLIAIPFLLGFFANDLYLKKAYKAVQESQQLYETHKERVQYLNKKGGVSFSSLAIAGIFYIGFFFLDLYLQDYLIV